MTPLRRRMLEDMQIRNFSQNTQDTYLLQAGLFARHFSKSPEVLGPEEIRTYQCISPTRSNSRSDLQLDHCRTSSIIPDIP